MFLYNQKKFVEELVLGLLSQTDSDCELVLSDDCSTDGTFQELLKYESRLKSVFKKVDIRKNKVNLGLVGHWNLVLSSLNTDYVIVQAGDDISLPERVETVKRDIQKLGQPSCLGYNDVCGEKFDGKTYDETESPIYFKWGLKDFIVGNVRPSAASRVFDLRKYRQFGELSSGLGTEDTTTLWRMLNSGEVYISSSRVLFYRRHPSALSAIGNISKIKLYPIFSQMNKDIKLVETSSLRKLTLYSISIGYIVKRLLLNCYYRLLVLVFRK
nr:glycosyltransferase family 2 protein [Shewanella halotolerans]